MTTAKRYALILALCLLFLPLEAYGRTVLKVNRPNAMKLLPGDLGSTVHLHMKNTCREGTPFIKSDARSSVITFINICTKFHGPQYYSDGTRPPVALEETVLIVQVNEKTGQSDAHYRFSGGGTTFTSKSFDRIYNQRNTKVATLTTPFDLTGRHFGIACMKEGHTKCALEESGRRFYALEVSPKRMVLESVNIERHKEQYLQAFHDRALLSPAMPIRIAQVMLRESIGAAVEQAKEEGLIELRDYLSRNGLPVNQIVEKLEALRIERERIDLTKRVAARYEEVREEDRLEGYVQFLHEFFRDEVREIPEAAEYLRRAMAIRDSIVEHKSKYPLTYATEQGDIEQIEKLLQQGWKPHEKQGSYTPWAIACMWGSPEVVRAFLRHGANVEARSNGNATCLHLAAWKDNLEVARYLLNLHVNVNPKDWRGKTPLDYARSRNFYNMVHLLQNAGTEIGNPLSDTEMVLGAQLWIAGKLFEKAKDALQSSVALNDLFLTVHFVDFEPEEIFGKYIELFSETHPSIRREIRDFKLSPPFSLEKGEWRVFVHSREKLDLFDLSTREPLAVINTASCTSTLTINIYPSGVEQIGCD